MLALMFRLFGQLVTGACVAAMNLAMITMTVLVRLLPHLVNLVRAILRGLLGLSFRLYALILESLAPLVYRYGRVDILTGYWRLGVSLFLSLSLGLLILVLTRLPVTRWSVGLLILHGLTVGLVGDEFEGPRGLQLGMRLQ